VKDVTDQLPPQSLASPSASTDSSLRLTDGLADQRMDTLAAKIEAGLQKQKDLLAELERDQVALQLLLGHPRGALPEAVPSNALVTASAASALQAADEQQRQRDEAVRYRERLEKVQREQPGLIAEAAWPAVDPALLVDVEHLLRIPLQRGVDPRQPDADGGPAQDGQDVGESVAAQHH
jgi:hypothetical protein